MPRDDADDELHTEVRALIGAFQGAAERNAFEKLHNRIRETEAIANASSSQVSILAEKIEAAAKAEAKSEERSERRVATMIPILVAIAGAVLAAYLSTNSSVETIRTRLERVERDVDALSNQIKAARLRAPQENTP